MCGCVDVGCVDACVGGCDDALLHRRPVALETGCKMWTHRCIGLRRLYVCTHGCVESGSMDTYAWMQG